MKRTALGVALGLITLLGACAGEPDQTAEQSARTLLQEASAKVVEAGREDTTSYSRAYQLYREAVTALQQINGEFSNTQVAAALADGRQKVGPYTVQELQDVVYQAMLRAEAEGNPLTAALLVAGGIRDTTTRALVYADIGGLYAEGKNPERASEVLARSLQMVRTIEYPSSRESVLSRVAGGYAKAGRYDDALKVAEAIEAPAFKATALSGIATQLAATGDEGRAGDVLADALASAEKVDDNLYKTQALADIAAQYARSGNEKRAGELLTRAMEIARGELYDRFRARALADIATSYAHAGDYGQAIGVARTIQFPSMRASALARSAGEFARRERRAEADSLLGQAHLVAREVEYPALKIEALVEVADEYVARGNSGRAIELLNEAQPLAAGLDPDDRASALARLGGGFARAGRPDLASPALSQALRTAVGIAETHDRASALAGIGGVYQSTGVRVSPQDQQLLRDTIRALKA